ncbi:MAG TPA: L,D-transpeptidase, partial [Methylophaga sp.]|nr:L,D-transpeptidase [Methylophaga sp.]
MNRIVIHALIVFAVISTVFVPVNADENIELVISRSKHQLAVKKDGVNLRTFKVAFGSGGRKAKLREGDHTTPKGDYQISKVRDSDRFYIFIQLNYPNVDDAKRAFKNHTISQKQYQAII